MATSRDTLASVSMTMHDSVRSTAALSARAAPGDLTGDNSCVPEKKQQKKRESMSERYNAERRPIVLRFPWDPRTCPLGPYMSCELPYASFERDRSDLAMTKAPPAEEMHGYHWPMPAQRMICGPLKSTGYALESISMEQDTKHTNTHTSPWEGATKDSRRQSISGTRYKSVSKRSQATEVSSI